MGIMEKLRKSPTERENQVRIVFLGLDHAGKTTIIKRITKGYYDEATLRTLGMNVDQFTIDGMTFLTWDIGGQSGFRNSLWHDYISMSSGIVFVVDAANPTRFDEARRELRHFVIDNPRTKVLPILILGNKQDLPNAADEARLTRALDLHQMKEHQYQVFLTSAKSGLNIEESLQWLINQLSKRG